MERVAAYKAVPTHSVYFLDSNGKLLGEPRQVAHGQAVAPPEYTAPEGRIFLKWSRDTSLVSEDVYCVALTKEQPPKEVSSRRCRVQVIDLRSAASSSLNYGCLMPLGKWAAGEIMNRDDLACLHLRSTDRLNPFRVQISCDTVLVLTDAGARAFDRAMRPLELLELVPHAPAAHPVHPPPAAQYCEAMQRGA